MRDDDNMLIPIQAAEQRTDNTPGLLGTSRELLDRGLKLATRSLVRPVGVQTPDLSVAPELLGQLGRFGARVTGRGRDLLKDVQGKDRVQVVLAEGFDAGMESPAKGGGNEPRHLVMVDEGLADAGTLLLAQRSEIRVMDGLILDGEVVVALCMADEMDDRCHVSEYG